MNIYIPMEIKAREFEGRGLLALVAAERGHRVLFGGKEDTFGLATKGALPPGIIHEKDLTPGPNKIKRINSLIKNGFLVTSQDEEHGLLRESYHSFCSSRFGEETVTNSSRIFTWGNYDAQSLCETYGNYCERIISTGSPRVDFWREEFAPYYELQDLSKTNQLKPYILIVSNFGYILDVNRFWDIIDINRKGGYYQRNQEGEYQFYEAAAYALKLTSEFIRMIRLLVDAFSGINVVVRPHPVESVDGWKKLVGDIPNVFVLKEGTISGWIRHAELIIQNGCTSALEAAACGTPRIAFRPIPSEFENDVANRVCHQSFSLEELREFVRLILNKKPVPGIEDVNKVTQETLKQRFSNLDGELASDRIVKEWEKILISNNKERIAMNRLLVANLKKRIDKPLRFIEKNIIPFVQFKTQQSFFVSKHKFPSLEEWEMKYLHENLKNTLDRFHHIRIKKFGRRSYIITSKK